MATNEGVGKKIVEALKKQSGQEIELMPDYKEEHEIEEFQKIDSVGDSFSSINTSEIDDLYGESLNTEASAEEEIKEDNFKIEEHPVIGESSAEQNKIESNTIVEPNVVSMPQQPQGWNFGQQINYDNTIVNSQPQNNSIET